MRNVDSLTRFFALFLALGLAQPPSFAFALRNEQPTLNAGAEEIAQALGHPAAGAEKDAAALSDRQLLEILKAKEQETADALISAGATDLDFLSHYVSARLNKGSPLPAEFETVDQIIRGFLPSPVDGVITRPPFTFFLENVYGKVLEKLEPELRWDLLTRFGQRRLVRDVVVFLAARISRSAPEAQMTLPRLLHLLAHRKGMDIGAGKNYDLIRWLRALGGGRESIDLWALDADLPEGDKEVKARFQDPWPEALQGRFEMVFSLLTLGQEVPDLFGEFWGGSPEEVHRVFASNTAKVLGDKGWGILVPGYQTPAGIKKAFEEAGFQTEMHPGAVLLGSHPIDVLLISKQPLDPVFREIAKEAAGAEEPTKKLVALADSILRQGILSRNAAETMGITLAQGPDAALFPFHDLTWATVRSIKGPAESRSDKFGSHHQYLQEEVRLLLRANAPLHPRKSSMAESPAAVVGEVSGPLFLEVPAYGSQVVEARYENSALILMSTAESQQAVSKKARIPKDDLVAYESFSPQMIEAIFIPSRYVKAVRAGVGKRFRSKIFSVDGKVSLDKWFSGDRELTELRRIKGFEKVDLKAPNWERALLRYLGRKTFDMEGQRTFLLHGATPRAIVTLDQVSAAGMEEGWDAGEDLADEVVRRVIPVKSSNLSVVLINEREGTPFPPTVTLGNLNVYSDTARLAAHIRASLETVGVGSGRWRVRSQKIMGEDGATQPALFVRLSPAAGEKKGIGTETEKQVTATDFVESGRFYGSLPEAQRPLARELVGNGAISVAAGEITDIFTLHTDADLVDVANQKISDSALKAEGIQFQVSGELRATQNFQSSGLIVPSSSQGDFVAPEGVQIPVRILRAVSSEEMRFLTPLQWIALNLNRNLSVEQVLSLNLQALVYKDVQGRTIIAIFA